MLHRITFVDYFGSWLLQRTACYLLGICKKYSFMYTLKHISLYPILNLLFMVTWKIYHCKLIIATSSSKHLLNDLMLNFTVLSTVIQIILIYQYPRWFLLLLYLNVSLEIVYIQLYCNYLAFRWVLLLKSFCIVLSVI